ncbi:hypothetical protein C8R43DRAFT_1108702 [Mycena crocata]|nr:hypothetical protein C8R43DRAFT_1108702 [Mycena crocata]
MLHIPERRGRRPHSQMRLHTPQNVNTAIRRDIQSLRSRVQTQTIVPSRRKFSGLNAFRALLTWNEGTIAVCLRVKIALHHHPFKSVFITSLHYKPLDTFNPSQVKRRSNMTINTPVWIDFTAVQLGVGHNTANPSTQRLRIIYSVKITLQARGTLNAGIMTVLTRVAGSIPSTCILPSPTRLEHTPSPIQQHPSYFNHPVQFKVDGTFFLRQFVWVIDHSRLFKSLQVPLIVPVLNMPTLLLTQSSNISYICVEGCIEDYYPRQRHPFSNSLVGSRQHSGISAYRGDIEYTTYRRSVSEVEFQGKTAGGQRLPRRF